MVDRVFALILVLLIGLPLLLLVLIATIDTRQFGIFTHERVGLHGKPFLLYKIRSLKGNFSSDVTHPEMNRSAFGSFLRQYHLDEWPQLLNIILGQMKFVGPRPDIQKAYNLLSEKDYETLTSVKPGITGITQIEHFYEEDFLAKQDNPEQYYYEVLWPEKVKKNIEYIQNKEPFSDLNIILDTLKKFF